jgi:arylformamidase
MSVKKRRVISLSHAIGCDTITYPGDPEIQIRPYKTIRKNGTNVMEITFGTHTATHMDAPHHVIEGGKPVDALCLTRLFGVARCVKWKEDPLSIGPGIVPGDIMDHEALFIDTGHVRFWNTNEFYGRRPCLSKEAVAMLLEKKISALGIDTPGVDPKGDREKYNHRTLLGNDILVYENLSNLGLLPEGEPFVYFSSPLIVNGADGAPVGVLALTGDEDLVDSVLSFKRGITL